MGRGSTAKHCFDGGVIFFSKFFQKSRVVDKKRSLKTAPNAAVDDVRRLPMRHFFGGGVLQKILRNHPDKSRNHGFHLELAKPLENLPTQFGTLFVPTFGQRTAPRRHIVHKKPAEIGRTRHKFVDLVEVFIAVTTHQHLFPDTFHSSDDERQIDAV